MNGVLVVLSETLYETVSFQVFLADPEILPGSSFAEGTSKREPCLHQ